MENLPMGKYIVCAEARLDDQVIQNNCFETIVDRLDNNSKYLLLCITTSDTNFTNQG